MAMILHIGEILQTSLQENAISTQPGSNAKENVFPAVIESKILQNQSLRTAAAQIERERGTRKLGDLIRKEHTYIK